MKIFLPLTCLMLLLTFQSSGQSVTLTLDNIPEAVLCNEIWTEQNVSLSFASTTTDDCTPDLCFFGIGDVIGENQSLWLTLLGLLLTYRVYKTFKWWRWTFWIIAAFIAHKRLSWTMAVS